MKKLLRTKMLPLLLIMALIASSIDLGFIKPDVVYAAEESTAPQQGTQAAASSIVLGKGTIEIDGHLFTDEEFQTFLSNAKIYRVPFEQSSTFSLGDYGEIVGEDAQAAGGLVILSNAIIGVFQKLSVIFDLAELAGSEYVVVGMIGLAAVRLAIQFLPDAIVINGVHINKFNSTLAGLTSFFLEHQKANPDEEIVDPDSIGTGGTTKPGEGTGDTSQPGTGDSDTEVNEDGLPIHGKIKGWTKHGTEQALARDGGVGVSNDAINDAVDNPEEVIEQEGGTTKYVGKDAVVVLNQDGKVVTTWANGSAGTRGGK